VISRFVLRYRGHGQPPDDDVREIQSVAVIVDRYSRSLLVDINDSSLPPLMKKIREWKAAPETDVSLPNPQQRLAGDKDP
jgi:hypothetical protein